MSSTLVSIITSKDAAARDRSVDSACADLTMEELRRECEGLDRFRRDAESLYERVRALLFLYAVHRFHLPSKATSSPTGRIPFEGVADLWARRFDAAIDRFLAQQRGDGPSDALSSALAAAYRQLAFQTLADQVRRSVRSVAGNAWMFEVDRSADHPLRVRRELLEPQGNETLPVLREATPVRMDLTHSAWSDIFFLGMDYPEGAKVLNVSIDLGVRGRDAAPRPPIQSFLRVLDRPVLRLVSVDLGAEAEIENVSELFDFAKDYLGLLKAAVIASGIVPPSLEGTDERLAPLFARVVGPGLGLEITSQVNGIPKGSRLAVSTNLLASLIALGMRATGQTRSLEGPLEEDERRLIVARAILGEWLGGSGGGWQDSGGLWPSIKLIEGVRAEASDPEFGQSRGRLLPTHRRLGPDEAPPESLAALQDSLVLVHGGLAQDVGPILEMVTERYLLRSEDEWNARLETRGVLEDVLAGLRNADLRAIGAATDRNFHGPITTIIPWATNSFTESLVARVRARFGERFWGFWMLGGMSGGGMGLLFDPRTQPLAKEALPAIMFELKRELEHGLPFAMDPVVYDFRINDVGSAGALLGGDAPLTPEYYSLRVPKLVRTDPATLSPRTRSELRGFGRACSREPDLRDMPNLLFRRLFPSGSREAESRSGGPTLDQLLVENGFDAEHHEEIRRDLRSGRIGLARNRLPADIAIEDVRRSDVIDATNAPDESCVAMGLEALRAGRVAVVTLAAGAGTRWTKGAGVVKALNPFCRFAGRHRTFLEVHLAKSRAAARCFGVAPPHVVTTSYLTHAPIEAHLAARSRYGYDGTLLLSQGRSVGLRLVPMARDLRFQWEECAQPLLDEQAQKVRESQQAALVGWARATGECSDYRDNVPSQCLHPVGHWYEVPNLLLNGTLATLLKRHPRVTTLLLHNVDTLGANLDPGVLGLHRRSGATLGFEVIPRRIEDRGGGLARVNGRPRLVESLALPREEDEFRLAFYNSMTTWIDVDGLLRLFGLDRSTIGDTSKVAAAVKSLSRRMPTYVTLKDVKKRWGHGQEDVFPVTQFEKLWGDMTSLPEVSCSFLVVTRHRGQQLKDVLQLDGWHRDGSAAAVDGLCAWS